MANSSTLSSDHQGQPPREPRHSSPSANASSSHGAHVEEGDHGSPPSISPAGPRKLIRPTLPEQGPRRYSRRDEPTLLAHQSLADHAIAAAGHDSSHAEVFYFQKQVQTQTLMCFVLDDGEKIEGYIEWFDRNAIKVRNNGRILIYKSSIKYLYKAGDNIR